MAVASELYPQIKKEKKKRKKPSPPNSNTHHSHLQPSCAYYYYFRNNLFNKNSCVSSPFPRILRSPPPFNNNLDNKNDRRAGQSAAAFSCLGSLGLRLSSPRKRWGGSPLGLGVRPCGPPVGPAACAGREGRPRHGRERSGGGGATARGTDWRGTRGSSVPRRGLRHRSPQPPSVQWVPSRVWPARWGRGRAGDCGESDYRTAADRGQGGGWGGYLSLHQGRSRYSGRGRGDTEGGGEEKAAGGAFNQHPLVQPTRHWRNKPARGWGKGGACFPEVLLQLPKRLAPPLFPVWNWGCSGGCLSYWSPR